MNTTGSRNRAIRPGINRSQANFGRGKADPEARWQRLLERFAS